MDNIADVRAEVFAGGETTVYRRAGVGTPVILLSDDNAASRMLFRALAERHRTYAPDCTGLSRPQAFCSWLAGLLDGLGVAEPVGLVADEHFAAAALEAVLLDAERVSRVVLLTRSAADVPAAMRDRLASVDRPLLLARFADDAAAEVLAFLAAAAVEA